MKYLLIMFFKGKLKNLFDGKCASGSSSALDQSQLSGIHPFMSAESISLDENAVRFFSL